MIRSRRKQGKQNMGSPKQLACICTVGSSRYFAAKSIYNSVFSVLSTGLRISNGCARAGVKGKPSTQCCRSTTRTCPERVSEYC